jgi:CHAT domain-containing protein
MLARRGDWAGAAEAFEAAIAAHESAVMARILPVDRATEIEAVGNTARWAAYALAAAGDAVRSVLVLETSRARELRRRLGQELADERAAYLPNEAREEYLDALQGVRDARGDQQMANAEFRLQDVLSEIRSLDGYGDFESGAKWSEVASAVEPGWPLVYVNPTPYGTVLLTVDKAGGHPSVDTTFLDITSHEVFMALMLGELDLDNPVSYLAGVDELDERVFPRALDEALAPLGQQIAKPLSEQLIDLGAAGVTLVLCGPIGLAPLHAAPWASETGRDCLLDHIAVRTTPSGLLLGTCRRRSEARHEREAVFVALANPDTGDPEDDLPGTDAEVEHLTELFDSSETRVARRDGATSDFLEKNARIATHLHIACHGKGGLMDPSDIAIWLADRRVSGSELVAADIPAHLTVLSACQTAVAAITQAPDEVTALSTIFLGSGSSAVVAAQWSIDDAATALLITNFYERMLDDSEAPAIALRHAQLWLRDLTDTQEAKYLEDRPALAAEFRRRSEDGRRPGFRGVVPGSGHARPTLGRYSHPQYWAPFVASGAA